MEKETSEIIKLTERISKDPKSKLFVPLAEEYKKAGDLEMAIHVLTEGLKNNPGYATARSILGRLLLERGDLSGSQKELEEVVRIIPDNLLAQRKLGDVCILQGKPAEALKHYKSVMALNTHDDEIASMISDIEAGRDVRSRIAQPKLQPTQVKAEQSDAKPQPSAVAMQQKQAVPTSTPTADQVSVKTPFAAPAVTPPVASTNDEPEEILIVEPLEKEKLKQESTTEASDVLSEKGSVQTILPSPGEPARKPIVSTGQDPVEARDRKSVV
jgi:hypothetical protein